MEEIGAELYSVKGPIYWLVGIGSGTTTEYFDYGSSPSVHGKIWGYPLPEVRTSISAYHVSLGGTGVGFQNSDLYAAGRSGEPFSSIFGGGDDPGSILPQGGKDVTAVEGDVTWNHWPFEVYSNVGYTQDSDVNGSAPGTPAERWVYGTVEPVYHFTPALYVAARYSFGVANAVHGVETDGWVDRIEVGAGYWVTREPAHKDRIRLSAIPRISAAILARSAASMQAPARGSMASFSKCRGRCNEPEVCHDSPVAKIRVQFGRRPPGGSRRISALAYRPSGRSATDPDRDSGRGRFPTAERTRRQSPTTAPAAIEYISAADSGTASVSGTSTLHDWTVQARQSAAECGCSGPWTAAPPTFQSIRVTIPVNSLKSTEGSGMDNTMYDALKMKASPIDHLRPDARRPEVRPIPRTIQNITMMPSASSPLPDTRCAVNLTLDIDSANEDALTIMTQTPLKMTDFGMKPPTAMTGMIKSGDRSNGENHLASGKEKRSRMQADESRRSPTCRQDGAIHVAAYDATGGRGGAGVADLLRRSKRRGPGSGKGPARYIPIG